MGGHDHIGEAYKDFQKALKALLNRGVQLAIASKNEEAVALKAIDSNPEMLLKKKDFAGWKIDWRDKAQNIRELSDELNLGLASMVFIDNDPRALALVRKNAGNLGLGRSVTLLKLDAARLPPPPRTAKTPAALAFLDPPYGSGLVVPALLGLKARGWTGEGTVCVAEVAVKEDFDVPKGFEIVDERTYGAARLVFLKAGP